MMVDFTGIENSKPCPDCRQALVTKDRCERCQALADCRSGSAELAKWLEEWRVKLNDVTAERDQLRAEAERLRGVSSMPPDYVKNVIRASRGDRKKMREATARAEAAEAIVATLRGALEEARKDNEELDGTDAAHPAWWRGNDAGVAQVCAKINAILDGADVFGTASEPWESTRRRVAEARRDSELLAWAWANPDKFADAQRSTPPNRTGRQQIDAARGTK